MLLSLWGREQYKIGFVVKLDRTRITTLFIQNLLEVSCVSNKKSYFFMLSNS